MSNFFCQVTDSAGTKVETDLIYLFNQDSNSTNLVSYTTKMYKNITDLGTYFKNRYNATATPTTNYNTTINYVTPGTDVSWTLTPASSTTEFWTSVSISSTGQNAIACISNGSPFSIYLSDNANSSSPTWRSASQSVVAAYTSVSISKNGKLGIASASGNIYYSEGTGNPVGSYWYLAATLPYTVNSLSTSADGSYSLAAVNVGPIYYSSNNLTSWVASNSPSNKWTSISISSTGQYGLACSVNSGSLSGVVYYSCNYGASWIQSNLSFFTNWKNISISSTGQYGFVTYDFTIYYSSNYGIDWTRMTSSSLDGGFFSGISISSTGQYGLVTVNGGTATKTQGIGYTSNYGRNWYFTNAGSYAYTSVCISSSGQYGYATINGSNSLYYVKFNTTSTVFDLGNILQPINPVYFSKSLSGLNEWAAVSISSDGSRGIAVDLGGTVVYSSNFGYSWTQSTTKASPNALSVSISSTGQYGITCGLNANIFYSSDYGVNWYQSTAGPRQWSSVSISSTGKYGLASVSTSFGSIYYSSNYCVDWFPVSGTYGRFWSSVSISSTGQYGLACANNNSIFYSSSPGVSFTSASITGNWLSVSISSTGQYGLACTGNGSIYYSYNYGVKWYQSTSGSGSGGWESVSISSTGKYGLACVFNGSIYYSSNYGVDWNPCVSISGSTNILNSVSISGTGQYGLACGQTAFNGTVFYLIG